MYWIKGAMGNRYSRRSSPSPFPNFFLISLCLCVSVVQLFILRSYEDDIPEFGAFSVPRPCLHFSLFYLPVSLSLHLTGEMPAIYKIATTRGST